MSRDSDSKYPHSITVADNSEGFATVTGFPAVDVVHFGRNGRVALRRTNEAEARRPTGYYSFELSGGKRSKVVRLVDIHRTK